MKFRVSLATVCGIAGVLLASGCSSILIRPAADKVQTVALVSVYMNRDFYDVRGPRNSVQLENIKPVSALVKGTGLFGKDDDSLNKNYEAIIAYGIKAYSEQLDGIGNWQWLPAASVIENDAYRKFAVSLNSERPSSGLLQAAASIRETQWHTAKDMVRIPMDRVTYNGKFISIGNTKDMRAELARLCKDLNVDAVAILEFDMAYQKLLFGLDFVSDLPATPSISSELVLVNKDGEVSVDSGRIVKGQGRRFKGKDVGMLRRDTVHLYDKSIDSYRQAIDKAADDMRKRLTEAFKKK